MPHTYLESKQPSEKKTRKIAAQLFCIDFKYLLSWFTSITVPEKTQTWRFPTNIRKNISDWFALYVKVLKFNIVVNKLSLLWITYNHAFPWLSLAWQLTLLHKIQSHKTLLATVKIHTTSLNSRPLINRRNTKNNIKSKKIHTYSIRQ
jgi:hypothetical protein